MGEIRPACPADLPRLVDMARAHHETARQPWPFNPEAAALFARSLMSAPSGFVRVLEVDGVAVGVVAASFAQHPMGGFLFGMEWVWWVDPEHRAGSGAVKLLAAYEAEARMRGCAVIGAASLAADDGVGRVLERRGFAACEQHFMKAL